MTSKVEQEFTKKGKPLSMTKSAMAKRKDRAAEKVAASASSNGDPPQDPPEDPPENPETNTGKIGVVSPEKPKPQLYHCSNCDGDVTMGMAECPTCEIDLNWPEQDE